MELKGDYVPLEQKAQKYSLSSLEDYFLEREKDVEVRLEKTKSHKVEELKSALINDQGISLKVGKYEFEEKTVWVLPKSMFLDPSKDSLAILFRDLAHYYDVQIVLKPEEFVDATSYRDDFFWGLDLSINHEQRVSFDSNCNDRQLGLRAGMALRFRHTYSESIPLRWLLRKKNEFFGNNPTEQRTVSKGKSKITMNIPFIVKSLISLWSPETNNAVYSILNKYLGSIGIDTLKDYQQWLVDETISWNQVLDHFKVSVHEARTVKNEPRKVILERRPKKPKSSPVFLKEEMDFILKLINPLWTDLKSIESNWPKNLFTSEDSLGIIQGISDNMQARNEVLGGFGNVSNKRFNRIKNIFPDIALQRKKDVSEKLLRDYLAITWENEVNQLALSLGKNFTVDLLRRAFIEEFNNEKMISKSNIILFVQQKIFEIYKNMNLVNLEEVKSAYEYETQTDINWQDVYKIKNIALKSDTYRHQVDTISNQMALLYTNPEIFKRKSPRQLIILRDTQERLQRYKAEIDSLDKNTRDCYNAIFHNFLISVETLQERIHNLLRDYRSVLRQIRAASAVFAHPKWAKLHGSKVTSMIELLRYRPIQEWVLLLDGKVEEQKAI